MKKNPKVILIVGLVALLIGAVLTFSMGGGSSGAQEQACRAEMAKRGAEGAALADHCNDANFAIAIAAGTGGMTAEDAAAQIAHNNQSAVSGGILGKFLLGFGLVLSIVGAIGLANRKQG